MFFGPQAESPPKKMPGLVDLRESPFIEFDTEIFFDPRKRVVLADGKNHVVARNHDGFDDPGFLRLFVPFEAVEFHTDQFAVLNHEALRCVIDDNLDALFFGVFQFPGGSFEEGTRTARHNLNLFAAKPERSAAAIHGGIADADDQNAFADLIDVFESYGTEPVDADVDMVGYRGIAASGQF